MVLDTITWAKDSLPWGETSDGSFIVKSVYAMLTRVRFPKTEMGQFRSRFWSAEVPEKVKVFF